MSFIGAVGTDDFGERLRANLEHCAVDTDLLRTAEGASGTAHVVVDDEGGNAIVVIPGANGTVTSLDHGDEALIGTADALLLQLELPSPSSWRAPRPPAGSVSVPSSPRHPPGHCPRTPGHHRPVGAQ